MKRSILHDEEKTTTSILGEIACTLAKGTNTWTLISHTMHAIHGNRSSVSQTKSAAASPVCLHLINVIFGTPLSCTLAQIAQTAEKLAEKSGAKAWGLSSGFKAPC